MNTKNSRLGPCMRAAVLSNSATRHLIRQMSGGFLSPVPRDSGGERSVRHMFVWCEFFYL